MYGFKFYIDGVQYGPWVGSATGNGMSDNGMGCFKNTFFILLNLAVGGYWPGNTIGNLPATFYVDYVRQYTAGAKKSTGDADAQPTFNADGSFACFTSELHEALGVNSATVSSAALYPNPLAADGQFNIKLSEYDASSYVNISIYDMKGAQVFNKLENSNEFTVSAGLKSGIYNVKIANGGNISVNKLLVR
jgi:hypothetical protein